MHGTEGSEDWNEAREFVLKGRRTRLVDELLVGAEELASEGYRRGALTEAVTALEVAIHEFARHPATQAFGAKLGQRMDVPKLSKQVEHLGLSGTVRYLLPAILKNDQVDTEVLRECSRAVEMRQNVVHNGQRDVEEAKLQSAIAGIRRLCFALERLQSP